MCEAFSLAGFSLTFKWTLTSREEHKMKTTTNHLTSGGHFVTLQKPSFCIWEKGKFPPNTLQDVVEKWKPA